MTKGTDDTYTLVVDRVELPDLAGSYTDENLIYYKIVAKDHFNNTATVPAADKFKITLEEYETGKTDDGKETTENEGLSRGLLLNIIILVIIVAIVAVILFLFIRKQTEKMSEDRHKLRMAIADVSEASAAGQAPPMTDGAITTPDSALPSMYGTEVTGAAPDAPQFAFGEGAQQPAGYLPESSAHLEGTVPDYDASQQYPAEDGTLTPDEQAIQQAGLMTGPTQPQHIQPQVTEFEQPGRSEIEIDKGLSVSLPTGAQPQETQQPTPQPPVSPRKSPVKKKKVVKK